MEKPTIMIPSLRRRHFYTWTIIGVLLPVLFILAWFAIPVESTDSVVRLNDSSIIENQPWAQTREYQKGTDNIVELRINQPLITPGTLIYVGKHEASSESESVLLGKVENSGIYKFNIANGKLAGNYLLFYDPFHKRITHSLQIQ